MVAERVGSKEGDAGGECFSDTGLGGEELGVISRKGREDCDNWGDDRLLGEGLGDGLFDGIGVD